MADREYPQYPVPDNQDLVIVIQCMYSYSYSYSTLNIQFVCYMISSSGSSSALPSLTSATSASATTERLQVHGDFIVFFSACWPQ